MKQFTFITSLLLSSSLYSAIEILDRVAVIVDDGVIMESQVNSGLENMIQRYDQQNIPKPSIDNLTEADMSAVRDMLSKHREEDLIDDQSTSDLRSLSSHESETGS